MEGAGVSTFGANNNFANGLNAEVLERGNRRSVFRYRVCDEDLNGLGVVHGGKLAGLMDLNLAMAAGSHPEPAQRRFSITLNMHINFVSEAGPGDLICRAWEIGGGHKTVFVEGRIEDHEANLIATGTGTFKLLPPGSENSDNLRSAKAGRPSDA
jgi:uncharacterized protein (TIGR00369 family)